MTLFIVRISGILKEELLIIEINLDLETNVSNYVTKRVTSRYNVQACILRAVWRGAQYRMTGSKTSENVNNISYNNYKTTSQKSIVQSKIKTTISRYWILIRKTIEAYKNKCAEIDWHHWHFYPYVFVFCIPFRPFVWICL